MDSSRTSAGWSCCAAPRGPRGPRSSRRTSGRISRGTSRRPAAPGRPDGHSPRRRRPRVRRAPRRGGAERPGPPRAGRRGAGVHLREGEERRAGEVRARGRRGHLDLNRARCRLGAHRVVAGRPPERAVGVLLHARPRGPAALAGAAHVGRAQLLREGRRGRVRVRCGLRPAREAPLDPRRRRAAPVLPGAVSRGRPFAGRRGARARPDLDQLRRASEPQSADGRAALHAPDQRVLEEARQPRSPRGAVVRLVQLLPAARDPADDAGAGGRADRQVARRRVVGQDDRRPRPGAEKAGTAEGQWGSAAENRPRPQDVVVACSGARMHRKSIT